MQGWHLLILDKQGAPFNHGVILQKLTPTKFLCQFARTPVSSRVCDITEIQSWHLFPTDEVMNAFILNLTKKIPLPVPAKKKKKKKVAKKKVAKKTPRRKSNVKK